MIDSIEEATDQKTLDNIIQANSSKVDDTLPKNLK
jgi:hypothetical protein